MTKLEEILGQHAKRYAEKVAVICKGENITYAQLNDLVVARVDRYRAEGVGEGSVVVLRAPSSIEFLVDYMALHLVGAVAVPLEKSTPDMLFDEVKRKVQGCEIPRGTADILFTTGTTGAMKGVVISHRTILADAENLIAGQGFSHDVTFIVNGPLNHIGSLSKIYPTLLLAGTISIVDGLKDMDAFFRAFESVEGKVATFLVPASIRLVLQFGADRLARLSDRMDFIETGAAPMPHADMQQLCDLLPNTRLYNTYASTETGIISTYNFNDGRCLSGCLGHTMPHSRLFITPEGTIACSGETLMTCYVGDPERTASIMRDGVVYTADNGRVDEEGMLHIMGRNDDVINVGGFKVAPTEVEDAAMSSPQVKDCICIGVPNPITGNALKLMVVCPDGVTFNQRELSLFLSQRLESYKVPLLYQQTESIARTYNGKLDRKYYRKQQ